MPRHDERRQVRDHSDREGEQHHVPRLRPRAALAAQFADFGGPPIDAPARLTTAARFGLLLILAVYGVIIMRDPGSFGLLDSLDLAIHEAGHVFFGVFGEFMGFLGGTLFQLLVPATFLGYFLQRHDRFAACVVLWWIGQNFWNISVYVKDARSMELPLVGGGYHDWNYLLDAVGLLHKDQQVGQIAFGLGVVCYLVAVLGGFRLAWRPVWKQTL